MTVYVYAVAAEEHPLRLEGLVGVGERPGELRPVRAAGTAAVVSDAPDDLRAKRRDLTAHQRVLSALAEQGAVLPLRFGVLAEDDASVARSLTERRTEYADRLRTVSGRAEFNLRAELDEDTVIRKVLAGNPEVRRLTAAGVGRSGRLEDRIALGEAVHADLVHRQQRTCERVVSELSPIAVACREEKPAGEGFLNVSFLVERRRSGEFSAAARLLAEQYQGEGTRLRLYGPLPPYSFV